jgi:hypothetical protein
MREYAQVRRETIAVPKKWTATVAVLAAGCGSRHAVTAADVSR